MIGPLLDRVQRCGTAALVHYLLPVEMAFPARKATPATWLTAIWEARGDGGWRSGCLIGPGATALATGDYDVYVRITSRT